MSPNYKTEFDRLATLINDFDTEFTYEHQLEMFFEVMRDWSQVHSLEEVEKWFEEHRATTSFETTEIPLSSMRNWHHCTETDKIVHKSGDFFEVCGVRVSSNDRESGNSWDQPILKQIGFDGGMLGLIRQRFDGVPHYLCEAKEEPGNYRYVQLSPTLQATFANIRKSHGGRQPYFVDYFLRPKEYSAKILFDAWLSEDGGRLYNKRNRGILIEIPEEIEISLPSKKFIWLSLFQIKTLLKRNAWINPHIRGILSHV